MEGVKLSLLTDAQLNAKFAKQIGWKLDNGKWWHDDIGDGPPLDYCGTFGRELAEYYLSALLGRIITPKEVIKISDQISSGAYI